MAAAPDDTPWRIVGGAVQVQVRLTPKGGRDAVDGLTTSPEGPALKARVRAAPEDNAANTALATLVAGWLGLPKRDVTLAGGHKSRTKTVAIAGEPADIVRRLQHQTESLAP